MSDILVLVIFEDEDGEKDVGIEEGEPVEEPRSNFSASELTMSTEDARALSTFTAIPSLSDMFSSDLTLEVKELEAAGYVGTLRTVVGFGTRLRVLIWTVVLAVSDLTEEGGGEGLRLVTTETEDMLWLPMGEPILVNCFSGEKPPKR